MMSPFRKRYTPPDCVLERYADVLVNYALHRGGGAREGEVVLVKGGIDALPLFAKVHDAILKAGANPVVQPYMHEFNRRFYDRASDEQLRFFPGRMLRGLVEEIDHCIHVWADPDPRGLSYVGPERIGIHRQASKPYGEWMDRKVLSGRMSRTLALYATEGLAREASMPIGEYWKQIIRACYLDDEQPVRRWKETQRRLAEICDRLNELQIDELHIEGAHMDLRVGLGPERKWRSADGENVPCVEVYNAPDCRRTQGYAYFNEPLYYDSTRVEGVRLRFTNGRAVEWDARRGKAKLAEVLAAPGGDRLGEVSLTDRRFSRITRFMAETLYDENRGGPHGNTHIALGSAYRECYAGDPAALTEGDWERLGYNDSAEHADIVSTEERRVTATLADGSRRVIYENGIFTV